MERKWTPGPWVADNFFQQDAHPTWVGKVKNGVPVQTIAEAFHDWEEDRISWKQAEANARLIASAPELYEALEFGRALISGDLTGSEWNLVRKEFLRIADEALDKAEGFAE